MDTYQNGTSQPTGELPQAERSADFPSKTDIFSWLEKVIGGQFSAHNVTRDKDETQQKEGRDSEEDSINEILAVLQVEDVLKVIHCEKEAENLGQPADISHIQLPATIVRDVGHFSVHRIKQRCAYKRAWRNYANVPGHIKINWEHAMKAFQPRDAKILRRTTPRQRQKMSRKVEFVRQGQRRLANAMLGAINGLSDFTVFRDRE